MKWGGTPPRLTLDWNETRLPSLPTLAVSLFLRPEAQLLPFFRPVRGAAIDRVPTPARRSVAESAWPSGGRGMGSPKLIGVPRAGHVGDKLLTLMVGSATPRPCSPSLCS